MVSDKPLEHIHGGKKPSYPHAGMQAFADRMNKEPKKFGAKEWKAFNHMVERCKEFIDYLEPQDVRLFFRGNELRKKLYFRKVNEKTTIGD